MDDLSIKTFKIIDVFYIREDTFLAVINGYQCFEPYDEIRDEFGNSYIIGGINRPTLSQVKGENTNAILLIKGKHDFSANQMIYLNH